MIDLHEGGLDAYLAKLGMKLRHSGDDSGARYRAIVNSPFYDKLTTTKLGLGIVVLLLHNAETRTVDRIALSDTFHAEGAVNMSAKPFKKIKIPDNHEANLIVKAIRSHTPQHTADWELLFAPAMSGVDARFNQAGAGIECSYVYPLRLDGGGALIFSYYIENSKIGDTQKRFMKTYAELVTSTLADIL